MSIEQVISMLRDWVFMNQRSKAITIEVLKGFANFILSRATGDEQQWYDAVDKQFKFEVDTTLADLGFPRPTPPDAPGNQTTPPASTPGA